MISEETINKVVENLVSVAHPEKIYLFGSYARGDAKNSSDIDFLVVEKELKSRRKEMVRLHDSIRSLRIPVDILVASDKSFNEWFDVPGTVINRAFTEGKLCYEKP